MTNKLIPADIRQHWSRIRGLLERIKRAQPNGMPYLPEDVYAACVNKDAVLYVNDDGFAVCTLDIGELSGRRDFFVWVAAKWGPDRKEVVKGNLPAFARIARDLDCEAITTNSTNPVFENNPDWTVDFIKYRHVLTDG